DLLSHSKTTYTLTSSEAHAQENTSHLHVVRHHSVGDGSRRLRSSAKPSGKGGAGKRPRPFAVHPAVGQDWSVLDLRRQWQYASALQREWVDPRERDASRQLPSADVAGAENLETLGYARPGPHSHRSSRGSYRGQREVPGGRR